jgi:hypothetical protein
MSIKKISLIIEENYPKLKRNKTTMFLNKTQDQFPYIEAAISILDENLKWWQDNWIKVESLIEETFKEEISKTFELPSEYRKIKSNFTIFNGVDNETPDITYNGPAFQYVFIDVKSEIIGNIARKLSMSSILKGHKIFSDKNKLIIMF